MRVRPQGVWPVELWDLPVDGAPLQAWRRDPAFFSRLARLVRGLRETPPARWSPAAQALCRSLARVYLLGGGLEPAQAVPAFQAQGLAARCAEEATYAAAKWGQATFRRRNGDRLHFGEEMGTGYFSGPKSSLSPFLLCADVGQTSVKLHDGEQVLRLERDFARAPLIDRVHPAERRAARASTLDFLAECLAPARGRPLLLALPCELDDAGVAGGCSYCWEDGDTALVPELAERVAPSQLSVLNDAELAAVAAAADGERGPTLVLTVGHGVGAAWLHR